MPVKKKTNKKPKTTNKKTIRKNTNIKKSTSTMLNNNELMTLILSYLGILVLIPLLVIKKEERNDFIKFHLEQGLNLFIVEIILWVGLIILSMIPFIGVVFSKIWYLIDIIIFVIFIIALTKGLQREKWRIQNFEKINFVKL